MHSSSRRSKLSLNKFARSVSRFNLPDLSGTETETETKLLCCSFDIFPWKMRVNETFSILISKFSNGGGGGKANLSGCRLCFYITHFLL